MMNKKILVMVLAVMVQGIIASDTEERSGGGYSDNTRNTSGNTSGNSANGYTDSTGSTSSSGNTRSNSYSRTPGTYNQQQQQQQAQELRLKTAGNGALFGQTAPFAVMDSNGQVSVNAPFNSANSNSQINVNAPLNPFVNTQNPYWSSGNTPHFPSLLGKRPRGLLTHFDPNLNDLLRDPVAYNRLQRAAQSQSQNRTTTKYTEDIDQGPLAPAPRSLMEQAGWWEYLALLFGESGDSTALRLILHRLSKLAQLQLGPVDAGRVQAATAFLANHFKPLLVNSFQDFVYDPDYTRNSAMWSSDPGFSSIIRRLVDQMDFFGAQEELERIFGPNTAVAVSFGMRQPEWLRLKLIMEQIAWDLKHPNDLIGLWSPAWNLTVPQKLSILAYASNPRVNAPLDLNLPNRDLVMARVNLITNGEQPSNDLIRKETPLDQAHLSFALLQSNGNLCSNRKGISGNSGNSNTQSQQSQYNTQQYNTQSQAQSQSQLTSLEGQGLKKRVDDYCEVVNLTPNFVQFCQTGPFNSTPIASLLASAIEDLFAPKVVAYINHLERLFWAFTWTGSCQDSREVLATLTNQIKVLGPRDELVRKGRRVPSGLADSLQVRLEYLQAIQQRCQSNFAFTGSADVAHIFSLLNYNHLDEALSEWERRFSTVAARLQGYPGGSILVGKEGQFLYQQARDVRIALLIYKYPRSIYVPCLSKGLLTRDPATDLTLLNLTHSLDTRSKKKNTSTSIDPLIPEMSARSLYMRALYLSGRFVEAARVAREIAAVSGSDNLVDEFLGCTQLCGSATRNPCEAEKTFDKLISANSQGASGNSQTNTSDTSGYSQNTSGYSQTNTSDTYAQTTSDSNTQTTTQNPSKSSSTAATVYAVGKELSSRLCRLSRNTASDALSLRYGKVLTTQATFSALKRIHDANANANSSDPSKLQGGRAESFLPWFGSMPPAPVDEILSFVPTRKLNFVSHVGIKGIPILKSSTGSDPNTSGGNADIWVLGKKYPASILTDQAGDGNVQPQTKLVNGIFQLATESGNTSGNTGGYNANAQGAQDNTRESTGDEE